MEKYFLGSNTHSGFVGFYEEITDNIGRVYLLKGGAGTGKSSLIRKVMKRGIDLGFCCEGWHCSGDPRSLDGVYIKGVDVAVIDATSPHAIEPKIPAVKDDIVNLLEYVEKGKLCKHKDVIEKLSNGKKESYKCGYEHLNIGYCHFSQISRMISSSMDRDEIINKARHFALDLLKKLRCEYDRAEGDFGDKINGGYNDKADSESGGVKIRKRFYRAITPDGIVGFFEHLEGKELWHIKGESATVNLFMKTALDVIVRRYSKDIGLLLTVFYNPLDVTIIDGFTIGNVAVVCEVDGCGSAEVYDLRCYEGDYDKYAVSRARMKMKDEIDLAVDYFSKARSFHMSIEKYYTASMDFDGINDRTERLIEEIFKGI